MRRQQIGNSCGCGFSSFGEVDIKMGKFDLSHAILPQRVRTPAFLDP